MCEPTRVSAARTSLRLLIDEDLSPTIAQRLRETDAIDAVALRDRGRLGATDREVIDLAFAEDRVLVTANVGDFERLATTRDLHAGIVLIEDGEIGRDDQLKVIRGAIVAMEAEARAGRDMVNRVLRIASDGTQVFEAIPPETNR